MSVKTSCDIFAELGNPLNAVNYRHNAGPIIIEREGVAIDLKWEIEGTADMGAPPVRYALIEDRAPRVLDGEARIRANRATAKPRWSPEYRPVKLSQQVIDPLTPSRPFNEEELAQLKKERAVRKGARTKAANRMAREEAERGNAIADLIARASR